MREQPERLPDRQAKQPPGRHSAQSPAPSAPAGSAGQAGPANPASTSGQRQPVAQPGSGAPANLPVPAPQSPGDLARLAESRRALDARSEDAPADRRPVPMRAAGPPAVPENRSDLTTTMPILVPALLDRDARSAPPGELGHHHAAGARPHHAGASGGPRVPKGVLVTVGLIAAVGAGIALTTAFTGGSDSSSGAQGAAMPASASGPGPSPDAGAPAGPTATGAASPSSGPATTATPSRTATRTPRPTATHSPTNATTPVAGGESTRPVVLPPPTSTAAQTTQPPSTPPPPTATTTAAAGSLRYGDTGPAVKQMQYYLYEDWYMDSRTYSSSRGTFDAATLDAVRQFQADHPGTAQADGDGVYGAATKAALLSDLGMGT